MTLNEIYAFFDTMPEYCPVCGEQLFYGVSYHPRSDFVTIYAFCGSGEVSQDFIHCNSIEKRDLEYLIFQLCNTHSNS